MEKNGKREDLIFKTNKREYNFQKFEIIRSFAKNIFRDKITLTNVDEHQSNLLAGIMIFTKNKNQKNPEKKAKARYSWPLKRYMIFLKV